MTDTLFPLAPAPSYYTGIEFPDRNGIFARSGAGSSGIFDRVGSVAAGPAGPGSGSTTVTATLSKAGATGYTVSDYRGATVSSGAISGTTVTFAAPVGGWVCGWYRVYLTGPSTDSLFGDSYGASSFMIVRPTAGYPTNTAEQSIYSAGESRDVIMKGVLGIGFSRLVINNAANPTDPGSVDDIYQCSGDAVYMRDYWRTDPARPRELLCTFPNGTADRLDVADNGGDGNPYLRFYPKDGTIDGAKVFVEASAGSVSGSKIQIYYPDAATLVETYDNLAAGGNPGYVTINAASGYVWTRAPGGRHGATVGGPTAIGRAYRDGIAQVIAALYPLGVTRYEGPANEPRLDLDSGLEAVQQMKLFQAWVHEAEPDAKAIGPCPVSISTGTQMFFPGGGGAYCDEIDFHDYGTTVNGDVNQGRVSIEAWLDYLASFGLGGKPMWQSEATHVFTSVYGVHHPQRSRVPLLATLLWEQYGLPRERNLVWYDKSHGFWTYPAWLELGDGSLVPYAALYRTLNDETFEKTHHHRIDFGSVQGNQILLGSVYTGSDDSGTAVIVTPSYIPDFTVTLRVNDATPALTVVDSWGNESVVAVTSSLATVTVTETPTYVSLPAGTHVTVEEVSDWGSVPPQSISPLAAGLLSGVATPAICGGTVGVSARSANTVPDTADLLWAGSVNVDRVTIVCGRAWQQDSALVDFDIQTTTNHVDWTTRATVTKDTPESFVFGTDSTGAGCLLETYWDEQWIFDVKLPASYACTGIRVNVRATSCGGEPDAQATANGLGQGDPEQHLVIQQIIVPSASTPATVNPTYLDAMLAKSPVLYIRCGEASGTTAVSQVNSPAVDGVYGSGCVLGQPTLLADGGTGFRPVYPFGYVTVPHNAVLDVADRFTIKFRAAQVNNERTHDYLSAAGSGRPFLSWESGVLTLKTSGGTVVASADSWVGDFGEHEYAITKNGATVKIVIDGVDRTGSVSNQTFTNGTAALLIGASDTTGSVFAGAGSPVVSEYAIFATDLSVADLADICASAATPAGSPASTHAPVIEGAATVSRQIACTTGRWNGNPTLFAYQWQDSADGLSGWTNITGATMSALTIAAGETGKRLRCRVTATNVIGNQTTANSAATAAVA